MKKIIISIAFVSTLFGYEVEMQKRFTKEIMPNKLTAVVSISTQQKTLEDVLTKLEAYSKFIKSQKDVDISDNGFHTSPDYRYDKNKRTKIGYRGSINYKVTSNDKKSIESFLNLLSHEEKEGIDLYLSSRKWSIDPKDLQNVKETLQIEAIEWAKKYAKKLSKKLDDRCKIEKITLGNVSGVNPYRVMSARADSQSKELPLAEKTKQKITLRAQIQYKCK